MNNLKIIKAGLVFIIILLCIIAANAQTVEQRVQTLEQWRIRVDSALGFTHVIEPIDTALPKPISEGIVMNSSTADCFIYSPPFIRSGLFTCYVNKGGSMFMASSPNGLNTWTLKPVNAPYGPIIFANNVFRGSAHKWYNHTVNSYYYGSQDGVNWSATAADFSQTAGEDRCLLYDNGIYRNYVRVQPVPRTIGYCQSTNFASWSRIIEVLRPDAADGIRTQFYQMSVIKTESGYFGLLNTYRVGDLGQDVEQIPPYTEFEHTVDLQLVYSANGKDNWIRLNNRKVFIPRSPGVKQQFGTWTVIGEAVYIYTIESKRRHTMWEDSYNKSGNLYFSSRYKISLADLLKYLQ